MTGWRLFVAVDVPEPTRAALLDWTREHCRSGWRRARPEQIHMTLRFLGESPPEILPRLTGALRRVAADAQPFDSEARGWGVFPGRSRPRVLWAGVADERGAIAALARAVESAVRDAGYAPETRPFRAHVTLARAARGARPRLPGPPDPERPRFGPLAVAALALYRSLLEPSGARYERLAELPLGAAGEGTA